MRTIPTTKRALSVRQLAYSVHKWAGLLTGALFLVTALTGFILLFTEDADLFRRPKVAVGASYADLGPALVEAVDSHPGYALTAVRLPTQPDLAWLGFLRNPQDGQRVLVDLDPYSGKVLGYRDYDSVLFRILLDLHYTYYAGTWGKVASSLVALCLVVLSLTGFWIYRGAIADLFRWRLRRGLSARGTLIWLHKWTGLWTLALSLIWGSTGVVFMISILPASFAKPGARLPEPGSAALRSLPDTSQLMSKAQAAFPEGLLISFVPVSRNGTGGPSCRVLLRQNWPWEKFGEVHFAPDGTVERVVQPKQASFAVKFNSAVGALHFGFLGSRWAWFVYVLGGLVMIFLPLSGYALWWLGRRARRTSSSVRSAAEPLQAVSR